MDLSGGKCALEHRRISLHGRSSFLGNLDDNRII